MVDGFERYKRVIGSPPGTLPEVEKTEKASVDLIDFSSDHYEELTLEEVEHAFPYIKTSTVTWININSIRDYEVINKIASQFNLHPLMVEDITHKQGRPGAEIYRGMIHLILKMLYYNSKKQEIEIEHISVIIGNNYVISFQEKEGDVFDPVRERIREGKGQIRNLRSDYLGYALIDTIVDNYFTILEEYGYKLEEIEEQIIENPSPDTPEIIQKAKRDMVLLRRSVWPLREVITKILREETELIKKDTEMYFRDVYEHTIQVIDAVESFRDMISGMLDIYLSALSNKMNEVMKVLTIFASIFIPLTFIAGIYGMNFRFMPELEWKWGYFGVLGFMFTMGLLMLFFFKRKDYL